MKKIIVAVTGGISAYKAADVISGLISSGNEVKVITTDNAFNFVTPYVLNVISKNNLITETPGETKHIELAKWCDAYVLIPATANTIAKITNGIADNLVTTTFLALPKNKKVFICPAMNTMMWENYKTQENLSKLNQYNIIKPVVGLLACGDYGFGKLAPTKEIVETINDELNNFPIWRFPLNTIYRGITEDSYSFLDFNWNEQVEIPIKSHVGAFGVRRRHDVHKGIDLYAKEDELVCAVEHGTIVDICPFTGEIAGFPWWENTYGVYVEGKSGIVVYGEIKPKDSLEIGDFVDIGDFIGHVKPVLKKDNGRPRSMLHLELHEKGHIHCNQWEIGKPKPNGILDPTKYLLKSKNLK